MRYSGAMYPLVPATRVWTRERPSPASGKRRAMPKSAILGTHRSSRRMLLALMSRWMMGVCASSWRYSRPRATPTTTSCRRGQVSSARSNRWLLLLAGHCEKTRCQCHKQMVGRDVCKYEEA
ncbi:hypothetical protein HU200_037466 [Digitaria exilis]|uniref:Uncharacterized protein n=1 Tax=Digitaria exilis TaxID=1010633 RepID=A0A835EH34_9POAL|nr:hypothetical protein HU200_037466 [Digitaria exilis]